MELILIYYYRVGEWKFFHDIRHLTGSISCFFFSLFTQVYKEEKNMVGCNILLSLFYHQVLSFFFCLISILVVQRLMLQFTYSNYMHSYHKPMKNVFVPLAFQKSDPRQMLIFHTNLYFSSLIFFKTIRILLQFSFVMVIALTLIQLWKISFDTEFSSKWYISGGK